MMRGTSDAGAGAGPEAGASARVVGSERTKPTISGRDRVVLTVTERPGGRDAVALSAGFAYAANAAVSAVVDAIYGRS